MERNVSAIMLAMAPPIDPRASRATGNLLRPRSERSLEAHPVVVSVARWPTLLVQMGDASLPIVRSLVFRTRPGVAPSGRDPTALRTRIHDRRGVRKRQRNDNRRIAQGDPYRQQRCSRLRVWGPDWGTRPRETQYEFALRSHGSSCH